jgi:hypothetical protein
MYAEYDHEDGYEMLANLTSGAFSKAYLKESDEEAKARRKSEYEEMLLAKKFKVKAKYHLSDYDLMLMGRR